MSSDDAWVTARCCARSRRVAAKRDAADDAMERLRMQEGCCKREREGREETLCARYSRGPNFRLTPRARALCGVSADGHIFRSEKSIQRLS